MNTENETTQDDPQTDTTGEEASATTEAIERALGDLVGIGRLWAAHGLTVGRSALETSATTLRVTADLLGELSDRVRAGDAEPPTEATEDAA